MAAFAQRTPHEQGLPLAADLTAADAACAPKNRVGKARKIGHFKIKRSGGRKKFGIGLFGDDGCLLGNNEKGANAFSCQLVDLFFNFRAFSRIESAHNQGKHRTAPFIALRFSVSSLDDDAI